MFWGMRILTLVTLSLLTACASDSSPDESGTMTDPDGPRFLTFGTDRASISVTPDDSEAAEEMIVLSAVLTDPDGVEDVVGGTLYVDGTNTTLGTFATSAQEGAYTMIVTWAQLAAPLAAKAEWSTDLEIPLRAEFFDQAGHVASKALTLSLSCEGGPAPTKVTKTGCIEGVLCEPMGVATWCASNEATTSGDAMCSEEGLQCLKCLSYFGYELPCSDTTTQRNCQCE